MNNYIQELCYPVTVLISCVSHRHVLLRHSWAIQSGAMLSPLMGREWEDASGDQLGTTRTMESHKNLHSQDVSLVFPLPWSEKHKNYIYSSNNHGVVLKDCEWPIWFVNQPTASQSLIWVTFVNDRRKSFCQSKSAKNMIFDFFESWSIIHVWLFGPICRCLNGSCRVSGCHFV